MGGQTTTSQVAEVGGAQQQKSSSFSPSSSSSSARKSALSKTITTTTTTTTTTQNNQDQPQVAQIKEIRVHTVPLSEAVHYANYMVVPSSRVARLEESSSSSSSSSHKSASSTASETEQVAVAPAPTVVVDPPPAVVAPDCVIHRLVVERPVSSQLVVNVPPEVKVSHSSSSSSHSSKIVSHSAAAPETTVYSVRRVFAPPPVYSAKVVQVAPAPAPSMREEHFRSESQSSRQESHGLGHSMSSSSSSSSSSRTSKSSSTTTTSQSAALVAPPPPPVRTVTTIVRQAAPLVAVKAAPLVELSAGRNDVSVNVDHHQSGPNYNYGYSIKQHSSEPATKGVVVGDRVVYLKK